MRDVELPVLRGWLTYFGGAALRSIRGSMDKAICRRT